MKKLGVCVVGLGFVGGQAHVSSINKIKNSDLVAVCDLNDKQAVKYATKYGCKKYLSIYEALKDPDIDAVVIAVPVQFHYRLTMDCIKAGKHILLELPLSLDNSQSKKVVEAARKAKVTLMPALNFRFAPIYRRVKQMIKKEKVLGKGPTAIHYREYISANLLAAQWPPNSWAWSKKKSGGPLFTMSMWSMDLFRWLLDAEVKQLHAVAENHSLPKYGGTHAYVGYSIMEFTNGTILSAQYSGGVCSNRTGVSMQLIGENTHILTTEDTHIIKLNSDELHEKVEKIQVSGPKVWGHYQQDEHFVNCVLKGKAPDVTPKDGLIATEYGKKMIRMYRDL